MPSISHNLTPRRRQLMETQAAELVRARRKAGLNQIQAAALFEVSYWTYKNWEQAKGQPAPATRARIVAEWGCDPKAVSAEDGDHCPHCGRLYRSPTSNKRRPS